MKKAGAAHSSYLIHVKKERLNSHLRGNKVWRRKFDILYALQYLKCRQAISILKQFKYYIGALQASLKIAFKQITPNQTKKKISKEPYD